MLYRYNIIYLLENVCEATSILCMVDNNIGIIQNNIILLLLMFNMAVLKCFILQFFLSKINDMPYFLSSPIMAMSVLDEAEHSIVSRGPGYTRLHASHYVYASC